MKAFFVVAIFACFVISYDGRTLAFVLEPSPPAATPAAAASAVATAEPSLAGPVPGLYMTDFTLKSLDGASVALHDVEGKAMVVNFFATWCPPCRDETAGFVRIATEVHPENVAFVGIDFDEKLDVVKRFADAQHMNTYPILLDDGGNVETQLGINVFPTTILVGSDGIVRFVAQGGMSESDLMAAIDSVIEPSLVTREYDAVDANGVTPLTTYTFDLVRKAGGASSYGTFKADVFSRAHDYVGVRAVELWTGSKSEARFFGSISPDGALDFGSQQLDAISAALFSFFEKHLVDGHTLDQTPQWLHTATSQRSTLSVRLTLSSIDKNMANLHAVGSTMQTGSGDAVSYAADVAYDSASGMPVSGSIASGGQTVTFALRHH